MHTSSLNCDQINKAEKLFKQGNVPDATAICQELLNDPDCGDEVFNLLGLCYLSKRNYHEAANIFLQAIEHNPENAEYYTNLAKTYICLKTFDEAFQSCKNALNIDPFCIQAHLYQAHIFIQNGQLFRAEISLSKAQTIDEKNASLYFLMGRVYELRKRPNKAIEFYKKAIKYDPDMTEANRALGLLLQFSGQFSHAVIPLRKTLEIIPHDAHALFALANCYAATSMNHDAIIHYKKAVELQPHNPVAHFYLGEMYYKINDPNASLKHYNIALTLQPNYSPAYISRSLLYIELGRKEDAEDSIKHASDYIGVNGEKGIQLSKAVLEEKYGDLEKAKLYLEQCLTKGSLKNHTTHIVKYHMGSVLEKVGQYDEAFDHYHSAKELLLQTPRASRCNPNTILDTIDFCKHASTKSSYISWKRETIDDYLIPPVFIVGFPQSGTVLLERLFQLNPDVITTKGAPIIEDMFHNIEDILGKDVKCPEDIPFFDKYDIAKLRKYYNERILEFFGKPSHNKVIIDKRPSNIIHLLLIHRIFPDSKILTMIRDPRDVIINCFTELLPANDITLNFTTLDNTVLLYQRVMDLYLHYKSVMNLPVLEVNFGDLIHTPEIMMKTIYHYLGLNAPNDKHHKFSSEDIKHIISVNKESIASNLTIDKDSIGRWRHFSCQLVPHLKDLQTYVDIFTNNKLNK